MFADGDPCTPRILGDGAGRIHRRTETPPLHHEGNFTASIVT